MNADIDIAWAPSLSSYRSFDVAQAKENWALMSGTYWATIDYSWRNLAIKVGIDSSDLIAF